MEMASCVRGSPSTSPSPLSGTGAAVERPYAGEGATLACSQPERGLLCAMCSASCVMT